MKVKTLSRLIQCNIIIELGGCKCFYKVIIKDFITGSVCAKLNVTGIIMIRYLGIMNVIVLIKD